MLCLTSGIPRIWGGGGVQQIQLMTEGRENEGSAGNSPLVRGSTQFANKWNPYSD
jgi:hypothetical protein